MDENVFMKKHLDLCILGFDVMFHQIKDLEITQFN